MTAAPEQRTEPGGPVDRATALDVLLQNTNEGFSYFDDALRLVAMNRRCLELLDFPLDEFRVGDPFEKFVRYNALRGEYGPGDIEAQVRERVALARRFEAHDIERTRPNGTVLRIRGTPVPEGGFVTTYTDITSEKLAVDALRRNEELLRTIVDHIPSPIQLKSLDGRYLLVNRTFRERRGLRAEDIIGRTAADIFPPEVARLVEERDAEVVRSGEITTEEARAVGADGIERHYLATRFPILDAGGLPAALGSIGVDITDLVQVREALARSEARFRDFAESSSDWLWETDEDQRFTFYDGRSGEISGRDPATLLGHTRREFAEPAVGPERWAAHQADLDARRPFRDFIYTLTTTSGRELTVNVSGMPVFDKAGRFQGYRGTATDITEQRRAETARDRALAEAERANQAKSEFLATMSHELRTPLNAILGFSEILENQYFGPPGAGRYREYAGHIHASGAHLLDLVNDLLDISVIEAGRTSLSRERLPIDEVIGDCTQTLAYRARAKDIVLTTAVAADLPPLHADRRAIKQVLLNLVSNATKFTPPGGGITVRARRVDGMTEIAVADTGTGIPEELLPQLTDPFDRHGISAYRTDTGWGLGLAISASLIRLHGGTLTIDSVPDRGTTVTVLLP